METTKTNTTADRLTPYLSPLGAWALSIGASIGWGSLVMTGSSFLGKAGIMGSAIGLLLGTIAMIVIAWNYSYMIRLHPDSGGLYTYVKTTFGYDRAYLASWFLVLTYFAMFWANATSLPLFAQRFFGDIFRFGHLYRIFGYDVYLGEVLLTIGAIIIVGLICARRKLATSKLMLALCLIFCAGITVCFVASVAGHASTNFRFEPLFLPQQPISTQIMLAAYMTPWAFVGFEGISHSAEGFLFKREKAFRVMVCAIVVAALLYFFIILMSASTYPHPYESWTAYIADLDNVSGLDSLPAFHAARYYLGSAGTFILAASLLALVITSLVANVVALSRLLRAVATDDILPRPLIALNDDGTPENAIMFVTIVSLIIPFLGRTAIGWIVDVTTVGAIITYGFVSATTREAAKEHKNRASVITGTIGLVLAIVLGLAVLLPTVIGTSVMAPESYILFVVWSILGFLYFRLYILARDDQRRFGNYAIVWVALTSLTLLMSVSWMNQVGQQATSDAINEIRTYYENSAHNEGFELDGQAYIDATLAKMHRSSRSDTLLVMCLFGLSLGIMFSNFTYIRRREEESHRRLGEVQSVAYTDSLTGVKSKHAYVDWEQRLDARIGSGEQMEFAIVVMDVNGLKHINDTLGHKAGDAYIRSASALVCNIFKHSPVFRIGGDEFVAILEDADYENRDKLIAEFRRQVEDNLTAGEVVVSEGMSLYNPDSDKRTQMVFERADALMYERKVQLKAMGAITRE